MKKVVWLMMLPLLVAGCSKSSLAPREYVSWMSDESNGLKINKTYEDYEFSLQYKTPEYIALMEKKDENIPMDSVAKRAEQFSGLQHYTLTIKPGQGGELMAAGISSEEEYFGRLQYMMESMQDDIYLVEGKDTIPCALFHYERNYGVSALNNFVIGFASENKQDDKVLVLNDRILGTGPVKFTISASDIRNIPSLKAN